MQRSSAYFKTKSLTWWCMVKTLLKSQTCKLSLPLSLKDWRFKTLLHWAMFRVICLATHGEKSVEIVAESRTNSAFRNGFCILTRNVFSCLVHITFETGLHDKNEWCRAANFRHRGQIQTGTVPKKLSCKPGFGNVSCNLFRNRVARQAARNIAQRHSAFSF